MLKDSTRQGVSLQTKREGKEAVTDEDEEKCWSVGLFGSGTAKQLLDTIYFWFLFMFGLRGGEHRKICGNNFSIGPNVINFEENVSMEVLLTLSMKQEKKGIFAMREVKSMIDV